MPPETLLIFGAVACLGVFFAAAAIAALVIFVRRTSLAADRQTVPGTAEEYFDGIVPQLQAWRAGTLADLSAHLEMVGTSALGSVHYRGTLKSLSQPEGAGLLAYELRLKRAKGPLILRTSAGTYQLDIDWRVAQVTVDGAPLGSVRTEGKTAILLSVGGEPIGQYLRQRQRYWSEDNLRRAGFFDPSYGPVDLRGRRLAEINSNPIRGQHLLLLEHQVPAMLQSQALDLAYEEEAWLVALTGMEIYWRIVRRLSTSPRRR